MISELDFSFIGGTLWPYLRRGFLFSLQLTLAATLLGIVFGTLLAMMRLSGARVLSWLAAAYVDGMRSIPLVMVILWFFLLIPVGFYTTLAGSYGMQYRNELCVLITFTAFEAAYFAEIMRAGIQSVSKGQVNAGYAVGMTYGQCMRLVVLPQAFRNMLPVLLTQTLILFQDTSLVFAIGADDLLRGFITAGVNLGRKTEAMLLRQLQKKIRIIR